MHLDSHGIHLVAGPSEVILVSPGPLYHVLRAEVMGHVVPCNNLFQLTLVDGRRLEIRDADAPSAPFVARESGAACVAEILGGFEGALPLVWRVWLENRRVAKILSASKESVPQSWQKWAEGQLSQEVSQ